MNPAQTLARAVRRGVLAVLALLLVSVASAGAASAGGLDQVRSNGKSASGTTVQLSTGSTCSSVRQVGDSVVVPDKGMEAFTVRQYIGWCYDHTLRSAWMNFSTTYVWQQYHDLGFNYRAAAGVNVEVTPGVWQLAGDNVGLNRERLVYSDAVRTVTYCTRGWGRLYRYPMESAAGNSQKVC